ncbi:beta-glucosidase [Ktedonosporobacter rubrisoli]|nr:glycoside hydrolase family 3 C-terminal domain-containing protein [Ktedonosporobacter rubrisoli]
MRNIFIKIRPVFFLFVVLLSLQCFPRTTFASSFVEQHHPWMKRALAADLRADLLLAQMTLDEKIALLHGIDGSAYGGHVPANPRLGIPALNLEDGPAGVADNMTQVTALAAPIAAAATWDEALVTHYGRVIGREERAKGANIVLAPTVNILRIPQWGRSFESLGEDPYLTSRLASADIRGIQSQGVLATIKHYAANNQEYHRGSVSANVAERTLHEIYLPAFKAVVQEAGVGAIMCSYNRVNDIHACEQPYLLDTVLRKQWKFPGFVLSDWGATHSTVASAQAGLDMQMPNGTFYGAALKAAVQSGQVSMALLDRHVHRILRTMFAFGLFDHPPSGSPEDDVRSSADTRLAREVAEQGAVLLKNDQHLLPFEKSKPHSIAVIGPDALVEPMITGGGSAHVNAPYVVTPLQGITRRAGHKYRVNYAQGLVSSKDFIPINAQYLTPLTTSSTQNGWRAQFYAGSEPVGKPAQTRIESAFGRSWHKSGLKPEQQFRSARWTGLLRAPVTATYTFALASNGGARLYLNNRLMLNSPPAANDTTKTLPLHLIAGQQYKFRLEVYQATDPGSLELGWRWPGLDESLLDQAIQVARTSDVAVVFANDNESESLDRGSLALPGQQDRLIQAIAQANPHTLVVLNTGAPVLMPWLKQVQAVMEAWYPGQEDGNAIAALLFGDVNPAGRLPMTFPMQASDVPAASPVQYPGIHDEAEYSEGIYVGYRHYDARHVAPLFPFGYGLSYTTFAYHGLAIVPHSSTTLGRVAVKLAVTNTGQQAGAEVVQLYLGLPSTVAQPQPLRQLKAFRRLFLQAGQTQEVTFWLDASSLATWDTGAHDWIVQAGTYSVMLGSSERDIHLQGSFQIR